VKIKAVSAYPMTIEAESIGSIKFSAMFLKHILTAATLLYASNLSLSPSASTCLGGDDGRQSSNTVSLAIFCHLPKMEADSGLIRAVGSWFSLT
jgi:hypothetical protein